MTKENRNPKQKPQAEKSSSNLELRHSSVIRHSPAGPKLLSKGRSFVIYFREWSVAFALFALLLVLAVLAPGFFQKSQLLSICSTAVPVLLVACGIAARNSLTMIESGCIGPHLLLERATCRYGTG